MAKGINLGINYCLFRKSLHLTNDKFQPYREIALTDLTNKRRELIKKELIGYSMEQMFNVASDVGNYYKFIPYVKKSLTHDRKGNQFKADLIVGFPPLHEIYTSTITLDSPYHVHSVCNDGRLFNYLLNEWKFSAGPKDLTQSCVVDFKVCFEFKSLLHSNVANIFFDMICEQMENAFVKEAQRRYGAASIKNIIISSHRS